MKNKRSVRDILSGNSMFLQDYPLKDGWYCRIIRSTILRGSIVSILVDPEFISLGAYLIQQKDIPGETSFRLFGEELPVLSGNQVHYFGQPVALLVAESEDMLNSCERLIQIQYEEYDPLPETLSDPQQIYRQTEKSIGSPGLMWEQSVESVESSYHIGTQSDTSREVMGCFAEWGQDDLLRLIGPTIWPHLIADSLSSILKRKKPRIEIVPTNPGVFHDHLLVDGSLIALYTGIAAELTGKNIKLILSEEERQLFGTRQPPIHVKQHVGFSPEREILVNDVIVDVNTGAFALFSTEMINQILAAAPGLYKAPSWRVRIHLYRSNLPPMSIFHGFHATLMQIPAEIQANRIAELEGRDPLEWRMERLLKSGDTAPPQWTLKEDLDSQGILERLAAVSDFTRKHSSFELLRKRRSSRDSIARKTSGKKYRGMGMSYGFQPSGFSRTMEQQIRPRVRVSLETDGSVQGYVNTAPGTSAAKVYIRNIIKEELGVESEKVMLHTSDSREIPDSGPVCLSRSLTVVTDTFRQACKKIQKQRFHSPLPISIETSLRFPRLPGWDQEKLEGDPFLYRSYGAAAVEVELDPVSFIPEIQRIWMVVDAPSLFNVSQARSALEGGIMQCLNWIRGYPREFKNGVLQLPSAEFTRGLEHRKIPEITIDFIPGKGARSDRTKQNGFRDLPFALIPSAYLSALTQATGGYFDSIPSDSQVIFNYIRESEEAEDDD